MFPSPFGPRVIFDDITAMGHDRGNDSLTDTMVHVAPVDLLVAGISCRDASVLSSRRAKRLACIASGIGTTGATAAGLMAYVRRRHPAFIIVENVTGLGRESVGDDTDDDDQGSDTATPTRSLKRPRLNERRQSHASACTGSSNTDALLSQLREAGYVAACVPVGADEFGSVAPRKRLYFFAVLSSRCQLTNNELRSQLQASLQAMRVGPGVIESCLETDQHIIAAWLDGIQRRQDDDQGQWAADHAAIFNAAGFAWPPNPSADQMTQSCWGFLTPDNLSTLTPREQDMIRYLLLCHVPRDFQDASGTPRVWAFDLYHNLTRVLRRSPRGQRCKPLVTVLPHSDMFLVMAHQSRLVVPP